MNRKSKLLPLVMVLCMFFISMIPTKVWANSAEPPSLVILINNPPKDLSIVMESDVIKPKTTFKKVAWEGYYVFYKRDMKEKDKYTFKVTANGENFECTIDAPLKHYNNVFTLDISKKELRSGKYPFRTLILVLLRLTFTLLIEGLIFWLYKYRQKRSWIVFLVINVITQGLLNIWLNSGDSVLPDYRIFGLFIGEFLVLVAEAIAFPFFIKEYDDNRIIKYAFIANIVSLLLGGYLMIILPI